MFQILISIKNIIFHLKNEKWRLKYEKIKDLCKKMRLKNVEYFYRKLYLIY